MATVLPRQLQENLLSLLIWSPSAAKLVRASVEPELWDAGYQDIARQAYRYIDKYKKAPLDHIVDLLDNVLTGKDEKKANRLSETLRYLKDSFESINETFIINRLDTFIRRQALKSAIVAAAPLLNSPEDQQEEIEGLINKALKMRSTSWDPGTNLADKSRSLAFLDRGPEAEFVSGVAALDKLGLVPARKTLYVLVAPPGRGKSWFLVNATRAALQQRQRVVYITLELSEEEVSKRMVQSFFAVPKRAGEEISQVRLVHRRDGTLKRFEHEVLAKRLGFDSRTARMKFGKKIDKWHSLTSKLYIKEFPTGMLSMSGLEGYLDTLYEREGFMPDLVVVDYPDLMKTTAENYRLDLGQIYKNIRGIGVDRSLAMLVVSQTTRTAVEARTVNEKFIAEDFSKVATADTMLFYTQTKEEKALSLARLYVGKARTEADKMTLLITQNYQIGQFVIDSHLLAKNYWKLVDAEVSEGEEKEDE